MRAPGGAGPALYWNEVQTARAPRGSVRRVTDRDSTGGVQPRAASRTGMVELQAMARTGTEQSPDASPPARVEETRCCCVSHQTTLHTSPPDHGGPQLLSTQEESCCINPDAAAEPA